MSDPAIETIFSAEELQLLDQISADAEAHNRTSVYNVPGYAPVSHETRHVPVKVAGQLPKDLRGVYLRNGANARFKKTMSRAHAFNGAGMLHQVQIGDGEVTYSNVFVRTPRDAFEEKVGREIYPQFSDLANGATRQQPKLKLIESKKAQGAIPNLTPLELSTASTAVQMHKGKLYCLNETAFPFVLNTREIEGRLVIDGTGRLETWDGKLQSPFSAHPRIDPENGTFYNVSIHRQNGGIFYSRLEDGDLKDHQLIHQQEGAGGWMAYLHDYIVSENHVIFPDPSLRSDRSRIGQEESIYYFDAGYKMRWGVLPRYPKAGDTVRWFETNEPGFIWHMVNGWEQTGRDGHRQIVLFAPLFKNYQAGVPIHSPEEGHGKLHKWVLDLETGAVEAKQLLDGAFERPSINPARSGLPCRYVYLLDESSGYMGKGVLKYDLQEEREVGYLNYGDALGGEALFVPREGASAEDDGYLVDLLMKENEAALVVFSAATLQELARIHLPARVPFGVHACWLDPQRLSAMRHGE